MGDFARLEQFSTVEELTTHREGLATERQALDAEWGVKPMPEDVLGRFKDLTDEIDEVDRRVEQREARARVIQEAAKRGVVERVADSFPQVVRTKVQDIWDLSSIRTALTDPQSVMGELRDRALKAIHVGGFSHVPDRQKAQEQVEQLVRDDVETALVARHILLTGSPTYQRAFFKTLKGLPLDNAETNAIGQARALSLAGAGGGFAVPYDLDPTIVPTSNGAVNPLREISRVVRTTVDTWRGVSSGAITAAYAAEATETTDNAPTLAQPEISTEKAQAFIPFSIEVGMDWPSLRTEMGVLLQDAKDALEATKFTSGSGTNEPAGVLTGTTNTVNAGAGQTFTLANLYALMNALPPRHRPNARFMGTLEVMNRIRQFDTGGGAALWVQLADSAPERLLGKPFAENSAMADVATSVKFLVYGNFSRFVIVDRIGLEIELIPHLFGSNQRPTGQRGLYAYWRNSSKVIDANAFRALIGVA